MLQFTSTYAQPQVDSYGSQYQYDTDSSDSDDYQESQQHHHVKKNPNFNDKQGLTSPITDLLGPDAAVS